MSYPKLLAHDVYSHATTDDKDVDMIETAIRRALESAARWVRETEGDGIADDFRDDFDL